MATVEKNTLLCTKDSGGNLVIAYPATTMEQVDGLPEKLEEKSEKIQRISYTLAASKWSENTYSLEAEYPSDQYELTMAVEAVNLEQYEMYSEAKIIGSATSNVLTALGTIPTKNIPVILEVIKK